MAEKYASSPALLVLEDGTICWGNSIGASGETFGELVFNTGMTGYQEVLTDPSYCGQIVVMTYPEIGIYGVNREDPESEHVQVAGFVVHRAVHGAFNYRADNTFPRYLKEAGIVAIEGVDTRMLTRRIRTRGAMRAAISTLDLDPENLLARVQASPGMLGRNLVREVQCRRTNRTEAARLEASEGEIHVALLDAGLKENIRRELVYRGARVTLVPYDTSLERLLSLKPDGVLISNGPGDPAALEDIIVLMRGLLERHIPLAGICLGHQLLGLAVGGVTYKMQFGHRGINHPVKDLASGRVLITTQNHGFAVDPTSLGIPWSPLDNAFVPQRPDLSPPRELSRGEVTMAELLPQSTLVGMSPLGFGAVEVTQLSLNDGTLEGMRLLSLPAFSVQYHPEASPGPHDAKGFFDTFLALVRKEQHAPA